jgi:hypothetical protein
LFLCRSYRAENCGNRFGLNSEGQDLQLLVLGNPTECGCTIGNLGGVSLYSLVIADIHDENIAFDEKALPHWVVGCP